jgi:hypothetical protein
MPRLAIFRSMHNVRPGEQHKPSRAIDLDATAVTYLRLCDIEVGTAWALDRLTDVRRRMEAEAKLLELYARSRTDEPLAADHRYLAVRQFIELAREAEEKAMTLVLAE